MGTGDGGRRRRRREGDDNDDGDEEYVLEEEEEEEEDEEEYGEELSASSAGEEGGGSDAEYEEDEEDEDDETPRPKRPVKGGHRGRKRKNNPTAVRSRRRRYEEDDDYSEELEEDDEIDVYHEDFEEEEAGPLPKRASKCGGRSQTAKLPPVAERSNQRRNEEDDVDFDPELDEEEEEKDMDFDPEVEDEEFEDEIEEELGVRHSRKVRFKNTMGRKPSSKRQHGKRKNSRSKVSRPKVGSTKARTAAPVRRQRKRSVIDHYEEDGDFIVEDQAGVNQGSRKKARVGRQMEVDNPVPVIEADAWPTVDSDTSDFDFVTSDEEPQDVEPAVVELVGVAVRKRRKKRKSVSQSSSDSEFHVSDKELGDFREADHLEAERKKRVFVSESSSDSEFHVSDKDLSDFRETGSLEAEMKKRIFVSESTSDSEFHVSDKELGDFRETEPLESERKKRIFVTESSSDSEMTRRNSVTRNVENKGKEKKEPGEAGKPTCGICLSEEQRMTLQGMLNCCSHYFCFACIMEWSRVESRCPLCKRRFTTITKSSKVDLCLEPIKSVIRVEERDQVYQPTEEEIRRWLDPYENLVCIECNQGGDDSLMLLCDICDSSAHTYCVGLGREVPDGNWYCGGCRPGGEGPLYPLSPVNSNSEELGTAALTGSLERLPSMNTPQIFRGFDLNVSPREIPGENHAAESQATVGLSTPSGRRATLSRRHQINEYPGLLLPRPRPAISPDMDHNGVQHSGYAPRTEPSHRNFCAPSEANNSQHSGSLPRAELNQRNFETTSEANTSQMMSRRRRIVRILLSRPRQVISSDVGHNGVQHSGSEPNRRNFCAPSEADTPQTPLDDIQNQHNGFPLV